jgi:hypothetical protein
MRVEAHDELVGVEKRTLRLSLVAHDERELIGDGTHARRRQRGAIRRPPAGQGGLRLIEISLAATVSCMTRQVRHIWTRFTPSVVTRLLRSGPDCRLRSR